MKKFKWNQRHPITIFLHASMMLLGTMLTMHPVMLFLSLIGAFMYGMVIEGKKWWQQFRWCIWIFAIEMLFFPCFRHNGVTPIASIGGQAITLESVLYGFFMSILLISSYAWFRVISFWIDEERLLYLFGSIWSSFGLLLSMIFRFLPMLRQRYREIQEVQRGLGRGNKNLSLPEQIYLFGKHSSILISWALEHTIETTISMESRGYGIGKRTTFHRFVFRLQDVFWCIGMIALEMIWGLGFIKRYYVMYYFPALEMQWNSKTQFGIIIYAIGMFSVAVTELCVFMFRKKEVS